jgi:hypothetical protein
VEARAAASTAEVQLEARPEESMAEVWAARMGAGSRAESREAPKEVRSAESTAAAKVEEMEGVSVASKEGCSGARSVAYLAEHQEAKAVSDSKGGMAEKKY